MYRSNIRLPDVTDARTNPDFIVLVTDCPFQIALFKILLLHFNTDTETYFLIVNDNGLLCT